MTKIRSIRLEADSPRAAWYELYLRRAGEGYVVEKTSGAQGSKPHTEMYYRCTLIEAETKFFGILNAKIRSKGPRRYRRVGVGGHRPDQLALFL